METSAIGSHLLHYLLAILAIGFCIHLFRHRRQSGWLFLAAIFLEPFVLLFMRAIRNRPLLPYKTTAAGPGGILEVSYRLDFPLLYILAVLGLYLLVRDKQRKSLAN